MTASAIAVKFVQKFVELRVVNTTNLRSFRFFSEKKMSQTQDLLSLKIVDV